MKKHGCLFVSMAAVLCLSVFLATGCGSREEKQTEETETEQTDTQNGGTSSNENESKQENDDSGTVGEEPLADSSQARTVTVYYVDDQTGEVTGKSVEIQSEYDIWAVFKESGLLTEDCELLSLNVNETEKKMELDFNSATGDRIRSMGTTGETQIVGCIINTYLDAYGCDGIRLTEEGAALQTSHGADFDGYSGRMTF